LRMRVVQKDRRSLVKDMDLLNFAQKSRTRYLFWVVRQPHTHWHSAEIGKRTEQMQTVMHEPQLHCVKG
jgi:hypothetical protein